MALEHARLCGACERDFPEWADRCPACGSSAVLRRIVIIPPAPAERAAPVSMPLTARSKRQVRKSAQAAPAAVRDGTLGHVSPSRG